MRLVRAFRLERVMLLMERPNLAHPRCAEFSGLVSQATEGRQKGTTCFGRWLAAPAVCLVGQGLTNGLKLQSDVGPGEWKAQGGGGSVSTETPERKFLQRLTMSPIRC